MIADFQVRYKCAYYCKHPLYEHQLFEKSFMSYLWYTLVVVVVGG